jgi:hypothetical protein
MSDIKIQGVHIETEYKEGDIDIKWSAHGIGFGHLAFSQQSDGQITCMNEDMSREFCKAVLTKLVDVAIFPEEPDEPREERTN